MISDMDELIEKTLSKASKCKPGEVGIIGAPLPDGMVLCIWYHTDGRMNMCDKTEEMTSERYDWTSHGCTNAQEWRDYIHKDFWDNL